MSRDKNEEADKFSEQEAEEKRKKAGLITRILSWMKNGVISASEQVGKRYKYSSNKTIRNY